jgi:hypothetical protein
MSTHYPRIRILGQNGFMLVREGLNLTFYPGLFTKDGRFLAS